MNTAAHRPPDRPGGDDPGRGRRLGIDVGSVRIGVAASDPDGILATPVETVRRDRSGKHPRRSQARRSRAQRVGAGELRRLADLVSDLDAVEVVVGLPRTLADRTGPSARDAIELAEVLARRIAPIPVRLA
ncbi:MAG: Holliday junction resolvase RuvX, partial [Mycobacterium sp.]|nr:Holliday junction resolvase RuvX [Mycobacterium sp.]